MRERDEETERISQTRRDSESYKERNTEKIREQHTGTQKLRPRTTTSRSRE